MNYQKANNHRKLKVSRWIKRQKPDAAKFIIDFKKLNADVIEIVKRKELTIL